jgi:hypothetical protein
MAGIASAVNNTDAANQYSVRLFVFVTWKYLIAGAPPPLGNSVRVAYAVAKRGILAGRQPPRPRIRKLLLVARFTIQFIRRQATRI